MIHSYVVGYVDADTVTLVCTCMPLYLNQLSQQRGIGYVKYNIRSLLVLFWN